MSESKTVLEDRRMALLREIVTSETLGHPEERITALRERLAETVAEIAAKR